MGATPHLVDWSVLPRVVRLGKHLPLNALSEHKLTCKCQTKYTLTEVVASLVAVEQPRTVILTEANPHDAADPDTSLEKAPLMDEEVMVFKEQPITSNMRKTIRHLITVGGSKARWRGLGASIVYHITHTLCMHLVSAMFGNPPSMVFPVSFSVSWILSAVFLSRIHATWTQVMISQPSALPWYRRIPGGRPVYKALILPSFVYAVAQLAIVIIPVSILAPSIDDYTSGNRIAAGREQEAVSRLITAIAAALFIGLAFVLPASVTLTRVEASLLPEDQETIVNFDRTLGGTAMDPANLTTRECVSMFFGAWKSFDRASRTRLVTYYFKMCLALASIVILGVLAVWSEIVLIGPEKLKAFVLAGTAQLELMKYN